MTVDELAARLRVAPATVRHWRATGRGPTATRVGRRIVFGEAAVAAWLDSQQRPKSCRTEVPA